jgi:hypothetical protein
MTPSQTFEKLMSNTEHENELSVMNSFLGILNFGGEELDIFFDKNRKEIDVNDKPVYLYLLVLKNEKEHFKRINEIFDDLSSNLRGLMAMKLYETPEDINELFVPGEEREILNREAINKAIEGDHSKALMSIFEVFF